MKTIDLFELASVCGGDSTADYNWTGTRVGSGGGDGTGPRRPTYNWTGGFTGFASGPEPSREGGMLVGTTLTNSETNSVKTLPND